MTAKVEEKENLLRYNLTPQELLFCNAYLSTSNSAEAARQAGYSAHSATSQGSRLLKRAHIKQYIDDKKREIQQNSVVDPEWVRRFWKGIADNGKQESNRLRASELIAKDLGMLKENLNINTAVFQNFGQEILSKLASTNIQDVVVDASKGIKDNTPKDQELTQVAQLKEVGY